MFNDGYQLQDEALTILCGWRREDPFYDRDDTVRVSIPVTELSKVIKLVQLTKIQLDPACV